MRPEDLRGLFADECVLLIQDSDPVLAQKVRYFETDFSVEEFEQTKSAQLELLQKIRCHRSIVIESVSLYSAAIGGLHVAACW